MDVRIRHNLDSILRNRWKMLLDIAVAADNRTKNNVDCAEYVEI